MNFFRGNLVKKWFQFILYDINKAEIPSQVRIVKTDSFINHPNLVEFEENSELEIIENFQICLSPIQKLILPATLHTICISFPNASNLYLSSDSLLKISENTKIFVRRKAIISGKGFKKMKKYIS